MRNVHKGQCLAALIGRGRGLNLDAVVVNTLVRQEKFELAEGS